MAAGDVAEADERDGVVSYVTVRTKATLRVLS